MNSRLVGSDGRMVELLLAAGASALQRNGKGQLPLETALEARHLRVVALLSGKRLQF